MKILASLAKLNPLPLLGKLNPIPKVEEVVMNAILSSILKKFGSSLLKGLVTLGLGLLTFLAGFDPHSVLGGLDASGEKIVLAVWAGVLLAIRAGISALTRALEHASGKPAA